uniref:NADH-ubiquinone oxidoreductase chain 4 n=1 Tax=Leptoglossus membranaceus TaxID=2575657 RepID=A0A4D6X4C3_9HEMI|nr:NADH dehydrogenase subunit 4 [Leptoglossus membranaceus]QCI09360.1 NADH dehydrogenase subunit 4 [Leptoglossus membranaceus]
MMKILFFILFLTPLLGNWWLLTSCLIVLSFYMLTFPVSSYMMNLSFGFGMDLVSYCMILLSIWIVFLMLMASNKIKFTSNCSVEFVMIVVLLLIFLVLTFSTSNLFMFYLFFESSMIPTLFLIFGWGYQPERFLAGLYLLFYTLFASFPLLVSIFYIFVNNMTLFYFLISLNMNVYLYLSLVISFLVKMPMIFVHFWLPKAHVEAPVSGSMILAGVLLKMGGYGLYRVMNFMNEFYLNYVWMILSLFGTFMVGMLCLSQVDIKSLIAYSSVAHMGLVIGGIMTCSCYGLLGSLLLMIGHGLCSSGMFALANIVYERSHSRSLLINKGFITFMPTMSMFWFLFSVNNMASPPSLNLAGEILLINSILSWSTSMGLFLALSSFLSCCYSIYLYSITQHGCMFGGLKSESGGCMREYILLIMHWLPLNFLFLKMDIFTFWV